ncbi:MAG: AAA family ATPase [Blastocatellia bacterium]|nr:AAA family ATPase [Blastocatellia bacterium]
MKKLNILIGANGAGKSNFIGVFKLLNQIAERNLQVYVGVSGGADSLLHFGRKTTSRILISLNFANENFYVCSLRPRGEDSLFFLKEGCQGTDPKEIDLGQGHKESNLREQGGSVGASILNDLKSWKVYHFNDTSDSARVKQTGDLEDNRYLRADAANLAAFLYMLKERHPSHYSNIVEATRLVAPFFDDFDLEPSRLNPEKIRLEWREKGSDAYFNASAMSDGTLRFICLSTLLLQPSPPSIILLDEPELGLHPYALTILAELLRGAATKTQVIVSTQSAALVNQFEPDDVIVVEREERQSVFRRLDRADMESWLDDYGVGDLWEKNVIGGRP